MPRSYALMSGPDCCLRIRRRRIDSRYIGDSKEDKPRISARWTEEAPMKHGNLSPINVGMRIGGD